MLSPDSCTRAVAGSKLGRAHQFDRYLGRSPLSSRPANHPRGRLVGLMRYRAASVLRWPSGCVSVVPDTAAYGHAWASPRRPV